MSITLILPVYNEAKNIAACVENLRALQGEAEILFADGGSSDETVPFLEGAGFRVIRCPKGRARQMNTAAKEAAGDILFFSHCDSILPPDALTAIEAAAAAGTRFGCFTIAFDYDGPFMGCNTFNSNLRSRCLHIAFGDQGMFLERSLFEEMGGFPEIPIMEDYELSLRLRKKRVPLRVLPQTIVTSGRRYRTAHPLRTMWQMFYLRCRYRMGMDVEEISRRYRDIR